MFTVVSTRVLARWLAERPADERAGAFTFVVGLDGWLRLAPRRSQPVDRAAGQRLLAAGVVLFARDGAAWSVNEISNQSAAYRAGTGRLHITIAPQRDGEKLLATPEGLSKRGSHTRQVTLQRILEIVAWIRHH